MNVGPDHERFQDTAGTYVLGALPDDEKRQYEAHMAVCPACQAEAEELGFAASLLPVSAPAMKAPPELKARIMAEVEREAALLASAGEPRREPVKEKRRRRFSLRMPAVALACSTLLVGVLGGALLFGGGSTKTVQFASMLPQTSAELEVGDNGATIVASRLPAPQRGKVYMVWLKRPGKAPEPTSALFTPRSDGSATAAISGDMDGVEAVLVNTEAPPGPDAPTSPVLMTASLT